MAGIMTSAITKNESNNQRKDMVAERDREKTRKKKNEKINLKKKKIKEEKP